MVFHGGSIEMTQPEAIAGVWASLLGESGVQASARAGTGAGTGLPRIVVVGLAVIALVFLIRALRDALHSGTDSNKQEHGHSGPRPRESPPDTGVNDTQSDGDTNKSTRRGVLAGAAGVTTVIGILVFFTTRPSTGPGDVAEDFVEAIDDSEFSSADEMVHPESPLDGAGDALDVIVGAAGIESAIDALDISVADSRVIREQNNQAVVDMTLELDLIVEEPRLDVPLEMRTADGDWHVWDVRL